MVHLPSPRITRARNVAEHQFQLRFGDLRRVPRQVVEQPFADDERAMLHGPSPVSDVPIFVGLRCTERIAGAKYAVAMLKRLGGIASHPTVVGERQVPLPVPLSAGLMGGPDVDHAQHGGQPPLTTAEAIAAFAEHVGNDVTTSESWRKPVGAAQAGNGRELVLEIGFAANRAIHKRENIERLTSFASVLARDEWSVGIEIETWHARDCNKASNSHEKTPRRWRRGAWFAALGRLVQGEVPVDARLAGVVERVDHQPVLGGGDRRDLVGPGSRAVDDRNRFGQADLLQHAVRGDAAIVGPEIDLAGVGNVVRHGDLLLGRQRELAALGLLETGVFALGGDLAEDGRVERPVGRLAAGARPEFLLGHRVDHLLGGHRRLRVRQHLRRGVEGASLLLRWFLRGRLAYWARLRCRLLLWRSFRATRGAAFCRRGLGRLLLGCTLVRIAILLMSWIDGLAAIFRPAEPPANDARPP